MTPKNIVAFSIGPIAGALLGLITLPVITWFFSQEDVGRMAMLQVTLGFSTMLFSLGLDQAYVREFHEVDDKSALLKHSILPGFILLGGVLTLLLFLEGRLAEWLFEVPEWHLSALVVLALLASFVSRFLSLVLRMNEQGLAFSMSQVLPKVLLLIIVAIYVVSGSEKSLTNLVVANTAAIVFVCLIFAWNTRSSWMAGLTAKVDLQQLKDMIKFGMPLILGGVAFWGLTAIDKIFIRWLSTYEQLGLYAVSVSFAAAASILQSVFSTIWAPTVYKWASSGEGLENVHKVSRYILGMVVLIFSLAGLFSWVVIYILPEEYNAVRWIVVSCMGYPLLYTLSETTVVGIGISRKTHFAMIAAVIAFVVNLLGNFFLIPMFGAAGAAVSTCVSFWVFFLLRTEFSIYLWQKMPRLTLYFYSAVPVAGSIIFTLWGESNRLLMIIFWLSVLCAASYTFKAELKDTADYIVRRLRSGVSV